MQALRVFLATLRQQRRATLAVGVGLVAFSIIIPASFQAVGTMDYPQLFEALPKALKALLKTQGELLLTGGVGAYLAAGLRHPIYLIIPVAFVIATASGAVAREVERGTILLVLARPIRRYQLLLGKIGALVVGLAALVAASFITTIVTISIVEATAGVDLVPFLWAAINAFTLFLAVAGYTTLISAVSNEGGRVTALATGVTVAFFFADFLSGLWTTTEPLGPLSIFHYYDPSTIVVRGLFPWRDVGVLLGVALAGFAASLVAFERRDIAR